MNNPSRSNQQPIRSGEPASTNMNATVGQGNWSIVVRAGAFGKRIVPISAQRRAQSASAE